MSPENASRCARLVVYGSVGAVAAASSPILSGILRGFFYALLILIVAGALAVVGLAQLIHTGIVAAL